MKEDTGGEEHLLELVQENDPKVVQVRQRLHRPFGREPARALHVGQQVSLVDGTSRPAAGMEASQQAVLSVIKDQSLSHIAAQH
ncbi:hypothetical protein [Phenylobacterium sp. J367]|uniref:hypothetical protein n=1 Tax=Phenylobacterium sp. J367 TaxID=2898435 RepID=UPI002150D00B|nr:hypothetical protein [Phenylobacterium sp. J367]MCR5879636.1 hypothetical protein [Phenylobacterium sp. J367]